MWRRWGGRGGDETERGARVAASGESPRRQFTALGVFPRRLGGGGVTTERVSCHRHRRAADARGTFRAGPARSCAGLARLQPRLRRAALTLRVRTARASSAARARARAESVPPRSSPSFLLPRRGVSDSGSAARRDAAESNARVFIGRSTRVPS